MDKVFSIYVIAENKIFAQTGVQFDGNLKAGYDLSYSYVNNPQQISNIADVSYRYADGDSVPAQTKSQNWHYDANGNLLLVNTGVKNTDGKLQKQNERKLLWDEENRLLALSDNGNVSTYWYDAAGERTVKYSGENQSVYVNGALSGSNTSNTNFTAYINPYLILNNGGYYSKHIYMGTERILSKLNSSDVFEKSPIAEPKAGSTVDYRLKYLKLLSQIRQRYDSLGVIYIHPQSGGEGLVTPESGRIKITPAYYYHSDHLGSSSLLSDNDGNVSQHIEYLPFGEVFVEERNNNWNTPYKFNAKELDEETGLYYYGARYFDSRTSVWYGVEPLGEKYPNIGSYVYCNNNPVNRVDPDGRSDYNFSKEGKLDKYVENDKPDCIMVESGVNDSGEKIYAKLDADAVKEFVAIVVGESTNNKDEATGIANVMLNRMEYKDVDLKSGFVDKIGGKKDFDAIDGKQYKKVKEQTLKKTLESNTGVRVEGAMSALSPLTDDNTNGAFFWNATNQKDAENPGWNWNQYSKNVYSKTVEKGGTTFFKYNPKKSDNPKHYKKVWP